MEDIKTFSDFLKLDNSNYFNVNKLIIDKDYYELNSKNLNLLYSTNFDFSTINFDIKLNNYLSYFRLLNTYENNSIVKEKFINYKYFDDFKINTISEYIELLYIFENNNFIKEKIINDYDINSFEISNSDTSYLTLNTVKILNDKNFNFELLRLGNVVNLDINIIRYLIDNKLYNFLNKNELNIIVSCSSDNFEFFINYFNFDVYKLYDNKNLCYHLYKGIIHYSIFYNYNNTCEKLKILYNKHNLLIDKNEENFYNSYTYHSIFNTYKIEDIINYNEKTLNTILIKEYVHKFEDYDEYRTKYINILDSINEIDIKLIIIMLEIESVTYYRNIDKLIIEKIITKLRNNVKLDDLIKTLKVQCDISKLITFYYLYFSCYDDSISSYINNIFNCDNLQDFENLIKNVNFIQYPILYDGINLIKKYYEN